MEDQERGMAGAGPERPVGPKYKDPAAKRWTIMIMGRVGKVRSFKVSPRVLFGALLFLALYFPLSIVVAHWWIELKGETEAQKARIEQLELELARAERSLFKFQQYVAVLDGYIASLETEKGLSGAAASQTLADEEAALETRTTSEEAVPGLVDIDQMSIEKETGRVKVAFNLVNIAEDDEPVSGYIHILASGDDSGASWWEVYPRGEVEQGMPVNYRVGQPFIIQRFKPIRGQFDSRPGNGGVESIRVVVYDDTGRLIYDGAFDVDGVS
ncbi:MAG: hypothetical protein ACQET7_13425 [Thermodesulfobacteriota bacterium]